MSRSRLLLVLFVALGLALAYAWFETPRQQRVTATSAAGAGDSALKAAGKSLATSAETVFDFSSSENPVFHKPKRDLFRPLYSAPEPVKQVVVVAPPPVPVPVPPPPQPVLARPPVVATRGPKPIPPLKVLGYLQKGPAQSAFLSSARGEIYVVKLGERFADDLLVRDMDADKIQISRDLTDRGVTLYFSKESARLKAAAALVSDRPTYIPVDVPQTDPTNTQPPLPQDHPPGAEGGKPVDP